MNNLLIISTALLSSLFFNYIFLRIKLPGVIGEICSGIIIIQLISLLPLEISFTNNSLFDFLYTTGLSLLMFISGLTLKNNDDISPRLNLYYSVCVVSLNIIAILLLGDFLPNENSVTPPFYNIFIAIVASVTSIPVLTRIFIDHKIENTQFAKLILTTASMQDLYIWFLLTPVLISINSSEATNYTNIFQKILSLTLVIILIYKIFPILLHKIFALSVLKNASKERSEGFLLILILLQAGIVELLGLNIAFISYLFGMLFSKFNGSIFDQTVITIKKVSFNFFIPIYFFLVGTKVNLLTDLDIILFFKFFVLTSLAKVAINFVISLLFKYSVTSSLDRAITMNARGGPGIVLASIGLSMNIISPKIFLVLVLTSIVTSSLTSIYLNNRKEYV